MVPVDDMNRIKQCTQVWFEYVNWNFHARHEEIKFSLLAFAMDADAKDKEFTKVHQELEDLKEELQKRTS
eukprot:14917155-Ditylum_brightwellii.AAC.1